MVIFNNCPLNLYELDKNKINYLGNWMEKILKVGNFIVSYYIHKQDVTKTIIFSQNYKGFLYV